LIIETQFAEIKTAEQKLNQPFNDTELVDKQIEITKYQAAGPVAEVDDNIEDSYFENILNPYPDQTPKEVLQRTYKVAEFSWGPITGTNIVDFPASLTVIPQIADKIKDYRFMRSAITVSVKLLTTQYHYGAYMVSWLPNHNSTTYAADIRQQSANRPIIISAADQGMAMHVIPYLNPYSFWETSNNNNQICRLFLTPLTTLLRASPDVTDTVKVQVYASFVDPVVTGYIGQSGNVVYNRMKMRQKAEGRNPRTVPNGKVPAPSVPSRNTADYAKSKRSMEYEAAKKTASGVVESATKATSTVASLFESIPMIGGVIENAVMPVLKALSILDKPTSLGTTSKMVPSFSNDLSLGSGLDNSNPLSLLPVTPLSMDLYLAGENVMSGSMTIDRVISTPMIHGAHTFTNALPTWGSAVVPRPTPANDDYVAFMSRFFTYWRGSFKYMFCFYTSTFITARVRISVRYNSNPLTDANDGDVVSRLVDIKGDTVVELAVPYLWKTMYRPTTQDDFLPLITVTLSSPIVGLSIDTDPSIVLVVWRAAGEDFVFNQMVTFDQDTFNINSDNFIDSDEWTEEAEAQMIPQERFRAPFDGIIEGTRLTYESGAITGEHITCLNDMLKRYVDNTLDRPQNTYPSEDLLGAFHRLSLIFKYWRGSRRLKTRYKADSNDWTEQYVVMQNPSGSLDAGNGCALTVPRQWNWNEFQVPWYSSLPFVPTDATTVSYLNPDDLPREVIFSQLDVASAGRNLISAGDDFVYTYLVAPP
jgi:hypothetical protein